MTHDAREVAASIFGFSGRRGWVIFTRRQNFFARHRPAGHAGMGFITGAADAVPKSVARRRHARILHLAARAR